jgi:hypothetical protein
VGAGKLTRKEVEEVLRRAAELEAERQGEADTANDEPGLGEPDLFRLGEEAGLSPTALRDALVEVRTVGVPAEAGGIERTLGDRQLIVSRTIPGPPGPIARAVERFLRGQLMTVRRHHGTRIEWQRARGLWPGLKRSLAFARQFAFGPVSRVETRVEASGPDHTHVSFLIDLAEWRRDRLYRALARGGAAFGFFGLGGAWLFPGFGAADLIALLAGGGFAGGFMALERRRFRESCEEVAVAPARFLDLLSIKRAKALPGPAKVKPALEPAAATAAAAAEPEPEREPSED